MKTAVVILNWNTAGYLESFLPRLIAGTEDACIIVADNGSTDSSLELLATSFPKVRTIALDRNYGFTGGYNRAVATLLESEDAPEYIVLLNSDIDVPDGWLTPLVSHLDSNPQCAACGPKLHALLKNGSTYTRSGRFEYAGACGGLLDRYGFPFCLGRVLSHTEEDSGQYDSVHDVLWASGACLAVRSSVWKRLGGLDDRFFAHMEEIDFCWRAQLMGYSIQIVPQSCVYHLGGGTLPQSSPAKLKLNYRNSLLLLDNNLAATIGPAHAARRIAARKAIDILAAAAYLVTGRISSCRAVLQAHREYKQMPRRQSEGSGKVSGITNICIIPQAMLRGKGIFEYIRRRYENSH